MPGSEGRTDGRDELGAGGGLPDQSCSGDVCGEGRSPEEEPAADAFRCITVDLILLLALIGVLAVGILNEALIFFER